jgi:acyl-CoA synthetase (AMP-forming)/AMP-acid ligase II
MEAIQKFGITTLFLPPTLIYMMLAHPKVREFDFSSLRSMLYGGAPMSAQKLREAMMIFGAIMYQIYGQSEALMICTMMTAADHQYALENKQYEGRLWSAGREGPFARVEIMDESGNILSPEQPGEVVVRSDLVMECYYRNPEATAEVSAHGWHHTGDVGRKDQDGFLYIMDRKKDMIISGGFNIFPTEVERALLTHPSIQDCAVVGVPDEKWGEAVLAAVELKQGASASTEEIIAYCKERLGSLKAPKKVEFVETLIRSTNGKVLRREVRAKYWKGRERNV